MGKASGKPDKGGGRKSPAGKRRKTSPSGRNRRRRWPFGAFLWVAKWSAVAGVWAVIAAAGVAAFYAYDLPDVDSSLARTRLPTVTLLAADGSRLATIGDDYGQSVRLGDLPPALPQAVLATEDRRFYDHFGLDIIGLARAVVANVRAGRIVQGGSTITQQVAKNLFLTPARTVKRKVQELLLALWLENNLSKDEILTVYLNRVYLGAGVYGVVAASSKYFGRRVRDLSVYQAALLAGLLKAPSRYNPVRNPKRSAARTRQVLRNMVDAGYLTAAQAKAAQAAKNGAKARLASASGERGNRYFADWIMDRLPGFVAPGDRDLIIVTTLDADLQRRAEEAVHSMLAGAGKRARVSQAALLALAPDGAVRAMVGGRDYRKSQYNRATQAARHPGSAFKPMVYLAGLEAGLTPDTLFIDAPVTIDGWTPGNFSGRYLGPVTLQTALARSINTVAVRVAEQAGRERVVATARRLGITAPLKPLPSLALGAQEVSLIELTAAYGPFANGGMGVWPFGIQSIRDSAGGEIYRRTGSGPGRVVEVANVAAMNRMLMAAVDTGTGRAARLPRPVAGKTGTSQGYRDAWFIGYSAELITGVWMGNDNNEPMSKVTGGGLPAKLWRTFMADAHKATPRRPLPGMAPPAAVPVVEKDSLWQRILTRFGGGEG